jgi:UDP-GlcNAc:undecaprenyl-phosphate GlcNAc-1-phosphate transferase
MPEELRIAGAAVLALVVTSLLAPLAMRIAWRTGCLDRPRGYRAHKAPTPYLGGVALISGFAIAVVLFGGIERFWPLLVGAVALAALGIVDDRVGVPPRYRVMAEVVAAGLVTAGGLGWTFPPNDFEAFLLNAIWIVGFTNAFNLLDNLDGASSTVAATCAAGLVPLAAAEGDPALAATAVALVCACLGFLRYNLRPRGHARIFLGDGGSMPLGFSLAVLTASLPFDSDVAGWPALLGASVLLGIPVLDTLLVTVSRTRRRIPLVTGGRDHLTHRLLVLVGTPARVAATIAVLQASVASLTIAALEYGRTAVLVTSLGCLAAGLVLVAVLDRPRWLPELARLDEAAGAKRDVVRPQIAEIDVDAAQAG